MKKKIGTYGLVLLIALLPVAYLAIIWDSLAPSVPLHFGADMKPDRFGNKNELWIISGVLAVVSIGTYVLLTNLHRIDPKRLGHPSSGTFHKLGLGLVIFLAVLNIIIINAAKGSIQIQKFLFPLIGMLFAFIGNYMNHIKPNYFAGIRLPWTLSSDENWRRTHQLAGKVWFAGGLLLAAAGLFLPPPVLLPVFLGLLALLIAIPVVYSYRFFKQKI